VPSASRGRTSKAPHTTSSFAAYALAQLPPAPVRVLEVGCGRDGGVAPALDAAGHDVLAIDPVAPEGPLYRRVTLEELDDPGPFDAVVAGRVLHHVEPLGPGLDKLAGLAPLLIVDDFARERVDDAAVDWYRQQRRALVAAGIAPTAPEDLGVWREAHAWLHSYDVMRAELDARYDTRDFEWRPYLYRWLGGPATKGLEEALIAAGALQQIGFRYTGRARNSRSAATPTAITSTSPPTSTSSVQAVSWRDPGAKPGGE
jgi:Methyltransferase domain